MSTVARLWTRPAGAFAVLFAAALLYWGTEYFSRELWAPDEARFAYVSQEMREGGHWLVPHRNGEYYAHKPPLMFWMINGAATVLAAGRSIRSRGVFPVSSARSRRSGPWSC